MKSRLEVRVKNLEASIGVGLEGEQLRRMFELSKNSTPFVLPADFRDPEYPEKVQKWIETESALVLQALEKEYPGKVQPRLKEQTKVWFELWDTR